MSCVGFLDGDANLLKNEMLMSDVNLYPDGFLSLKEEEKDDEKSMSEESNFQSFIKRELFIKEMNSKNFLSENEDDDLDDSRRYEISNYRKVLSNNINTDLIPKIDTSNQSNVKPQEELTKLNMDLNNKNKSNSKKVFNIIKVPKNKQQIFQCMQKKRVAGDSRWGKKFLCDWDNIPVPKEKHFHFDRKKHRIVFQRRHLKVIYSIVDLTYPFDFNKCFDMIKKHIGDKTVQNYDKGKSFHIIKINNEEKIVTLKDKKILLKQNKNKKKGISGLENNESLNKSLNKDEKSNCSTNTSNSNTTGNNSEKMDEDKDKNDTIKKEEKENCEN
jgi:hypothetical protein